MIKFQTREMSPVKILLILLTIAIVQILLVLKKIIDVEKGVKN